MLVLRKDMSEKFRTIKLLVCSVNIINSGAENFDYGKIWDLKYTDLSTVLREAGVKIVAYNHGKKISTKKAKNLGVEVIELNGNRKIDILSTFEGGYSFKDMVILSEDLEDIDLVKHARFSISTADAPLELKMVSHYVSNFSGLKAFEEIGNLIINAKRNNGQH